MPEDASAAEAGPRELGRRVLHAGRALELLAIDWRDADGRARVWETVERVGGRGAVVIVPWLVPSQRLLLIRQHRPPARGVVIEFPAGLIDPGEAPEAAARRELLEETGYRGEVKRVTAPTFASPGLSGEVVHQAFIEIDENLPENRNPAPQLDDGEHTEVVTAPAARLGEFLRRELAAGSRFDSKLMSTTSSSTVKKSCRQKVFPSGFDIVKFSTFNVRFGTIESVKSPAEMVLCVAFSAGCIISSCSRSEVKYIFAAITAHTINIIGIAVKMSKIFFVLIIMNPANLHHTDRDNVKSCAAIRPRGTAYQDENSSNLLSHYFKNSFQSR